MTDLPIGIRQEAPGDAQAILFLHERAFGPGRYARTAFRLRERNPDPPHLSFAAFVGTLLVGSVRMSRILLGPEPGLMLGPLAVEPAFEKRGIGAALTGRAIEAARADGHTLVMLVGDEPYYRRFGFIVAPTGRLRMPGPVDPARLLLLELADGAVARAEGRVRAMRG